MPDILEVSFFSPKDLHECLSLLWMDWILDLPDIWPFLFAKCCISDIARDTTLVIRLDTDNIYIKNWIFRLSNL